MQQSIYGASKGTVFHDCTIIDTGPQVGTSGDKFKHAVSLTHMGNRYVCNELSANPVSDFVVMMKYTIVILSPGDAKRPPLIKQDAPAPPATQDANAYALSFKDMVYLSREAMQTAVAIHSREIVPGTEMDIEVVSGTAKQVAKNIIGLAQDLYNEQVTQSVPREKSVSPSNNTI